MSTTKRLYHEAVKEKKLFIAGFIILFFAVVTELLGPVIGMYIIDHHIKDAGETINMQPILQLLGLYFLIAVVYAIMSYYQTIVFQTAGSNVIKHLRTNLFEHIQKLPIKYFDNLPAGKVVARITNDTQTILELFTVMLPTYIAGFANILGIIIVIFYFNAKVGLLALIVVPLLFFWLMLYRKISDKYNHIVRERNSDMNAMLNESINGMTIIQAFNQEAKIQQEYDELNKEYLKNYERIIKLDSLTSHNLMGIIRSAVFLIMIYIFGQSFLSNEATLTAGMMYILVDYLTRLFNPMFNIVNQLSVLEQARVSSNRVFEMMDETPEIIEQGELLITRGEVKFQNVSFGYKKDELVLKDINIHAAPGQTIGLVGHTGSGKSSIMNLLFRFYDPTEGQILIDGVDTKSVTKASMRSRMGIVLQDPYLYTGTILSNITLGDNRISRQTAEHALMRVGGHRVLQSLEQGIDTEVVERGATLSSGQRQLISFARALAFDPKILILDEATASIDSETEAMIQQAMDVLKSGRTTFVIAHRLSTIKNADQILVLDKGEIIEHGTHDELIALQGQYAKMYALQSGR
ncbi:ABC transporter ATP-binding protein [Macrococcoides caseolyticum]|uniref:ABC transporter ATP-binding protein n=1 Tax=Macrococcoides caseolyticum TaxID=69966 RepID=A0A855GQU8_9STAP|nr:ABC transporter ATP-binding protein [Macrococcus caseolyticus]PKD98011.1 ABC transporter ATP-binding protein [Macrococcus caseolyticus]PKE22622.1 ABC transporter ATP-binding protein [Macrococcus caseolyticus]PKE26636.1 ABC transporter ATP-binding protein [Macrococcus caseolyticus]PKE35918.1 ABC transporter ATP-binding protein [Macrococcus caseolyticus]PKE59063.1 ABC transporter ATP-binding protein [Macrococcus caseolyticus]